MAAVSLRSGKFECYLVHELKISQYSTHVCVEKKRGGKKYIYIPLKRNSRWCIPRIQEIIFAVLIEM